MSILIKGMAMPKNCETCELSSTDSAGFFGCCVTGSIVMRKREQERPSWCPLIEVPKHGRLIDADMLTTVTEMVNGEFKTYIEVFEVEDAPTIIESEGGKDNAD